MSFLSGLGSFAGGAAQGMDQGANIALKAQQIQQAQFALDQAKKDTAAQAAAFIGMTSGQGPQNMPAQPGPQLTPPPPSGPLPMPPGQPSVPSQPQAAPQQPPLQPAPGAILQGPSAPAPSGGAAPAPSPAGDTGGGAPANTSQIDPTDPQAGVKVVEMIARQIKAANPQLDPQTLLLATQRIIDMSKGMAPQLRAGAQVVVEQLRGAVQERNTDVRTQTQEDVASKNIQSREKIAAARDQTTLTATEMRAKSAMDRAITIQNMISSRVQSGQSLTAREKAIAERSKIVTAELTDATKRLAQLKNPVTGALPDESDPRVKAINKQIESATQKLKLLESATNVDTGEASAAAPATARPTATDAKGNKVEWDGKEWVPVKSGATK
jgi:hypothetical protein